MHIPSGQIGPGAGPCVLMFDAQRPPRPGRLRRMAPRAGLDARLFVGAEHVLARPQGHPLPAAFVEIEDPAGLERELRIAGEEPAAVAPRAQGILAEPAPHGGATDLRHDAVRHHGATELGHRPARQRHRPAPRQLTRQRFDFHDDAGGKSGLAARRGVPPRGRVIERGRNACATC
jgi:hypothetical protein